eukprot:TRINITY_DN8488_c0_g1_i2.p1 TRINITY_DN8488_c0_g1~~TRINITY_DN8488_c0_g1_i2.p1  ORF type:complete len:586 (-),score=75.87 TRINITY_DN8488_c0_g1_i2:689-2446(-)
MADEDKVFPSFFEDNDLDGNYAFWKAKTSVAELFREDRIQLEFEAELQLVSEWDQSQTKFCYCGIYKDLFLRLEKKGSLRITGYIPLTRTRLITGWTKEGKIQSLRFLRRNRTVKLVSDDQEIMQRLQEKLSGICVNVGFQLRYIMKEQIGKGGFSRVFRCIDAFTGKHYAAKVYKKTKILEDPKGKEGLANEIGISRKMDHPGIVKLYNVYESSRYILFVLELLEGGELTTRVCSKAAAPLRNVKNLLRQILNILVYLDSLKIMHRDIKPPNFVLTDKHDDDEIKLIDFGLAAFTTETEHIYPRCGTPGFVAPEIMNGSDDKLIYDSKCDVFSTGCIFYFCLTGQGPFNNKDVRKLYQANRDCQVDYMNSALKNASPFAVDLLKRMLETDPKKRISANEALSHRYLSEETFKEDGLTLLDQLKMNSIMSVSFQVQIPKLEPEGRRETYSKTNSVASSSFIDYKHVLPSSLIGETLTHHNINKKSRVFGAKSRLTLGQSSEGLNLTEKMLSGYDPSHPNAGMRSSQFYGASDRRATLRFMTPDRICSENSEANGDSDDEHKESVLASRMDNLNESNLKKFLSSKQ